MELVRKRNTGSNTVSTSPAPSTFLSMSQILVPSLLSFLMYSETLATMFALLVLLAELFIIAVIIVCECT